MLHIVLLEPEIPPNTGNIIRLSANTDMQLHLIKPLGFEIEDTKLKRAGLDYHEWARVQIHENFEDFKSAAQPNRIFACETSGQLIYSDIAYQPNDALLFGSETRGLPKALLDSFPAEQTIYIPMKNNCRSINLSNAVAIVVFEGWRQLRFR